MCFYFHSFQKKSFFFSISTQKNSKTNMAAALVREPGANHVKWIAVPVNENSLKTLEEEEEEVVVKECRTELIHHVFSTMDTLPMLALKYGTSVCEIKRLNRITTLDFTEEGSYLTIPTNSYLASSEEISNGSPPNIRGMMITDFGAVTLCTREEANYYLSSNDWNIGAALEDRRNDVEWEEKASRESRGQRSAVVQ